MGPGGGTGSGGTGSGGGPGNGSGAGPGRPDKRAVFDIDIISRPSTLQHAGVLGEGDEGVVRLLDRNLAGERGLQHFHRGLIDGSAPGVRPNSVAQTTSVSSSSPVRFRSLMSPLIGLSMRAMFLLWLSFNLL